jgi:crotonobetainyl-CoA:carnitine CoA-transferase CaiB-like acyl-CoA transferase
MERMDLLQDTRFTDRRLRGQNVYAIDDIVSAWTATRPRDALIAQLNAANVPSAPVRDLVEVVDDPHLHQRGTLTKTEHPALGTIVQLGSAIRFHGDDPPAATQSPGLGEHNREGEFETLGREGVI